MDEKSGSYAGPIPYAAGTTRERADRAARAALKKKADTFGIVFLFSLFVDSEWRLTQAQ
jgi:hypothetical protein